MLYVSCFPGKTAKSYLSPTGFKSAIYVTGIDYGKLMLRTKAIADRQVQKKKTTEN